MAEKYLIDTSAAIKYLHETLPESALAFMDSILNVQSIISFITQIELQVWNFAEEDDLKIYESFVAASTIIGISEEIIEEAIGIRKQFKLKIPDAIIAATSLANDLILIADNDGDFKKITSLKYINPRTMPAEGLSS